MKEYKDLLELVKRVQATGGMDTDEKSVCDYQDMIGHSTDDQLRELANGDYKHAFYRIYGCAYGTVGAIQFFTQHSDKLDQILRDRDEAICDREDALVKLEKQKEKVAENFLKAQNAIDDLEKEKAARLETEKELQAAQDEIIRLKARLFDLMEK